MVDKIEVKDIVANLIGDKYIIPTITQYDSVDMIDFDSLPQKFVVKCTHDSGGYIICRDKDKLDWEAAIRKLRKCISRNYYWLGREWPYKGVRPRIIIEKYMDSEDGDLTDYKLMCFNGEVKCIFTCTERFEETGLKVTFFDRDWNRSPFYRHYPYSEKNIKKP